jgi:hypothetical protein
MKLQKRVLERVAKKVPELTNSDLDTVKHLYRIHHLNYIDYAKLITLEVYIYPHVLTAISAEITIAGTRPDTPLRLSTLCLTFIFNSQQVNALSVSI